MAMPTIPGVPPQAIPVVLAGWLVVRNWRRRNGPGRVGGKGTPSRRSSTSGMDGEEVYVPRRNNKGSRVVQRR